MKGVTVFVAYLVLAVVGECVAAWENKVGCPSTRLITDSSGKPYCIQRGIVNNGARSNG